MAAAGGRLRGGPCSGEEQSRVANFVEDGTLIFCLAFQRMVLLWVLHAEGYRTCFSRLNIEQAEQILFSADSAMSCVG